MNPIALTQGLRSWRLWVLVAITLALTLLHQIGGIQASPVHQILDILPYVPILLGSLWFGLLGGVSCALLTSVCYATHLYFHEGGQFWGENLHRTLNILMFPVIGIVTGFLAHRQLETMERYRRLAVELEKSYEDLREKTEALFRNEEHLQRVSRLSVLGELTAGLAHEIGNPLGGIKGAAEILADGLPTEDPRHRFASLLLKEVTRLDGVVSRFLDFARPRAESTEEVDLEDVLQTVVTLCAKAAEQGEIRVALHVEKGLPAVHASPSQLEQAFLNLLLNAIQATPPGGKIKIAVRRSGETVECVVRDNGRGIPKENLPRLFDPFFTTRPGGTGLGLAITHRIVQGCGGRISVKSKEGEGTAFTVTIPFIAAPDAES